MGIFYDLLSASPLFEQDKMNGYSELEIKKIASLYDIKIEGMLYDFLLDIGRCDSRTFAGGANKLRAYCSRSIRTQVLGQEEFRQQLSETKHDQHVRNKPFEIAKEGVADSMFLTTASSNPDYILCFDENLGRVYNTNRTLYDYIKYWSFEHDEINKVVQQRLSPTHSNHYPTGEMIDFERETDATNV